MLGDSIRRRRPKRSRPGEKGRPGRKGTRARGGGEDGGGRFASLGWLKWLGVAVAVLLVSFAGGYLLATVVVFPPPETAGAGVPVPSLYGMDRDAAEQRLRGVGLAVGPVTEIASGRTAAGRVIAQEPVPEQQLRPGARVSLAVSAGSPTVRVPPVTGLRGPTARDLLEAAGFEVTVQTVRMPGPSEAVVRSEPAAGTVVRLPTAITIIVNLGPEEPEAPDDLVPIDSPGVAPVEPAWP